MISIVLSFVIFVMCFVFHVGITRKYMGTSVDFKKVSIAIFISGLVVYILLHMVYAISGWYLSGGFLYLSTFIVHSIYFTNPYLNDRSPSSEILCALTNDKKLSYEQIINLFTEKTLIYKRITDLLAGGYIKQKANVFKATKKGVALSKLISNYASWMKWEKGG